MKVYLHKNNLYKPKTPEKQPPTKPCTCKHKYSEHKGKLGCRHTIKKEKNFSILCTCGQYEEND